MDCTSLSLTSTDFFQLYVTPHSEEIKVVVLYHIATPSSLFYWEYKFFLINLYFSKPFQTTFLC